MSQSNTAMKATGGREASRERRERLVQGKRALPVTHERSRQGDERASMETTAAPVATVSAPLPRAEPVAAPAPVASPTATVLTGVEASRARRAGLVLGKTGLQKMKAAATSMTVTESSLPPNPVNSLAAQSRQTSQAMRAMRARNGRGDAAPTRPSGRVRSAEPIQYPAKVTDTQTYAGKKVTGVRIGRGANMTGDEAGVDKQVTGTQYIGRETGYNPREGGVKVGASRTPAGLVVTGTQVRSMIPITGDESRMAGRITGEADQDAGDDVLNRREQGISTSMQFQRQNNPHGHTVFGTNLGRSAKSVGSRNRDMERAPEQTDGGLPISGTAVGRSTRVTGDEAGSCHSITGDQYLMPASKQAACQSPDKSRMRGGVSMGMNGRVDPVTGEKVVISESWSRNRISGVDVEHNTNVTGDEYGVCAPITGTQYVGPGQYEAFCATGDVRDAAQVATPGLSAGNRVTGDTPRNDNFVTGTQRGGDRSITGTPYYRANVETEMSENVIEHVNKSFSVRSPQRDGQLRAGTTAVDAPSAASRITGTFAAGRGKITGNQEFNFIPRIRPDQAARTGVTGEGRVQGTTVTGSAWIDSRTVTGTEGYIASGRNPSERGGQQQAFAGSRAFKGKGRSDEPRKNVTGIVGWSEKTSSRITLSGGAKG